VKAFKTLVLTLSDTEFALTTSPEVFQKYGVEANSVVLFKKVKHYDGYEVRGTEGFIERPNQDTRSWNDVGFAAI